MVAGTFWLFNWQLLNMSFDHATIALTVDPDYLVKEYQFLYDLLQLWVPCLACYFNVPEIVV